MSVRDTIPFRIRQTYVALNEALGLHVGACGITGEQYAAIRVVGEVGSLTQRELGEFIASDPSTVSAMVRALERKGLVQRQPDPDDARAMRIRLTRKGHLRHDEVFALATPLRQALASLFDDKERVQFFGYLSRVVEVCGRFGELPRPVRKRSMTQGGKR